ncbi:MAG: RNA 2',3'-cyclic phosphodiesterase [Pseudomonadales bacterium]|nr:RNA 2',3'-cyclic phosphodiesterase [Pseudomonadales bacterium]
MPDHADTNFHTETSSSSVTRSFIGLPLADELSRAISFRVKPLQLAHKAQLNDGSIRWIPPENWHITLAFLGDQPFSLLEQLHQDLTKVCDNTFAFSADLISLAKFPDAKSRIIAALVEPCDSLLMLQTAVSELCDQRGITLDQRKFKPHITLARLKRGSEQADFDSVLDQSWQQSATWNRVMLYGSRLTPGGSVYQSLSQFALSVPSN